MAETDCSRLSSSRSSIRGRGPRAYWIPSASAEIRHLQCACFCFLVISIADLPYNTLLAYDDGRTQLLLCIHGLLPINFRGAAYNIPINVWITREYPTQPPIVYVVPTGDMLVRPGKFLEVSGRSNSEYMQQWERKSEGCNLLGLLEGLQHQFSNDPPVYAKPRETTPPPAPVAGPVNSSLSPAYSSRPPPPLPGVARSPPPAPATPLGTIQQVPQSPNRPVLPPKPGLSAEPIRPVSEGEGTFFAVHSNILIIIAVS